MKEKSKKRWILIHLIFLGTFPALATDMYLPALPTMSDHLAAPVPLVNLTLVLFFMFFGGSMIIWGTLSDKYGRKPILLIGVVVYVVAGILCAIADNVYQLILFRIFQAIGSGATISVSMAVMKDLFEGRERERVLAFANILFSVAPIIAPSIGSLILRFISWRGIFIVLAGFGLIGFMGCLIMSESAQKATEKSLIKTLGNLTKVMQNPGFSYPLILFSFLTFPFMMFLASSSNIYIVVFGLDEQTYSLFFGFNALVSTLGPIIFMVLRGRFNNDEIYKLGFIMIIIGGLLMVLFGKESPLFFAATVLPAIIASQMIRPPSANILLEQGKENAGAASSLMSFGALFLGSLGILFISLDWSDRIFMYGLVNMIIGIGCLGFWPIVWKKCKINR
jgi:DHA1 family bicyclomycin/chloramphenicol resistance-like MFS transporter